MSCQLELEGCAGTSVAEFHVKRFGQPGFVRCCGACWTQLVGVERRYEPPVKVNQPKLPSVPRRGAPASGDLPLYAPPQKRSEEPWF